MAKKPVGTFLSVLVVTGALGAPLAIPAQTSVALDLPAQLLAEALRVLGKRTETNILIDPKLVKDIQAPQVKGTLTVDEALKQLLAGTALSHRFIDEHTVVLKPIRAVEVEATSGQRVTASGDLRLARVGNESPQSVQSVGTAAEESGRNEEQHQDDDPLPDDEKAREVTVTGSRIRGLLGEQSTQPVLTITREDMERYGIISLGEVFRYIPQVSAFQLGQAVQDPTVLGAPEVDLTSNRVTAVLRGAPAAGTLLLVNGRRVPKTGQAKTQGTFGGALGEAYDLGGIPLAAVERIDVLLDGASAVYGADAVGGVINVILRENYNGTEARVQYENTFDSDASVKNVSLTHGFSSGGFSGLVTASWEQANAMLWSDRPFLRSYDRRFLGGADFRSFGFEGRGVVSSLSGNLPGLDTSQAAIPAGSDGVNLTVEDYANAGPLPGVFDLGPYSLYATPYERSSVAGNLEYEFHPALTVFAQARGSKRSTRSLSLPWVSFNTTVPAGAPGNPFDVPVRLNKFYFDIPQADPEAATSDWGLTAGLHGRLFGDWRYETSAHEVRSKPDLGRASTAFSSARVAAAFAGANPPILLYDSTAGFSPNAPGTLEALTTPQPGAAERVWTRSYDLQFDGPLFALPGGEVRVSIGAEHRNDHVDFPLPESNVSIQSHERSSEGYFAEMRLPLVSPRQGLPLLYGLEASLAARHDRYDDFPDATSPRYGLLYRPVQWLMLRVSRGEGYKVPTLTHLYQPEFQAQSFIAPGSVLDPYRGNTPVVPLSFGLIVLFGGNPDLRPEESENTTAGLVLEVPFIEGLSLSVDYYDAKYVNLAGNLNLATRLILFPDTILRLPRPASDPPEWLGPVLGYTEQPVNIALSRTSGYDFGLRYRWPTRWGEWSAQANASKTKRREFRTAPTQPLLVFPPSPIQLVGSVFLKRGALGLGVTGSYKDALEESFDVEPIAPSAIRWDMQVSYDFAESAWAGAHGRSWWGSALGNTRMNLTIFNAFDVMPPLYANSFRQPDNSVVDSRMRRYSLSLTRSF